MDSAFSRNRRMVGARAAHRPHVGELSSYSLGFTIADWDRCLILIFLLSLSVFSATRQTP
jgi:hypothetical protein